MDTAKKDRLANVYRHLYSQGQIKSKRDISRICSINETSVISAFNGDERYCTDNFMRKVCASFPDISLEYLISGTGDMLRTQAPSQGRETREVDEDLLELMKSQQRTILSQQESISKLVDKITGEAAKKGTAEVS